MKTTRREYEETYDALILSMGALPLKPPIPGIERPNELVGHNIPDVGLAKEAGLEIGKLGGVRVNEHPEPTRLPRALLDGFVSHLGTRPTTHV